MKSCTWSSGDHHPLQGIFVRTTIVLRPALPERLSPGADISPMTAFPTPIQYDRNPKGR
jgi:hypothetical protein